MIAGIDDPPGGARRSGSTADDRRDVADGRGRSVVACHDCATLHVTRSVMAGEVALCGTCGRELRRGKRTSNEAALALCLAALLLVVCAHLLPFMTLRLEGQRQTMTLLTGPLALIGAGMWPLAVLVFTAASLLPALRLAALAHVLAGTVGGRRVAAGAALFRLARRASPWAMMEVFLLGVIVAYVKLQDLALLELGLAVPAFIGVVILTITAESVLDAEAVWAVYGAQATTRGLPDAPLIACEGCGQLEPEPSGGLGQGGQNHAPAPSCRRCGAALHRRKPDALVRTWALLISAAVLYVPANLLPVMQVVYFGRGEPDTIMSGVVELLAAGEAPVAILVFFASIVVPCLKLIGLAWLALGVQLGWTGAPGRRTKAYRIIEGIGRWSMVDIFMISILVALVNLGAIATIEPGTGALCFAAVVVLTMLASASFDPRLIWDVREAKGARDAARRS